MEFEQKVKVAVIGASGYSGEELIRLLSRHAGVELVCVTSRSAAGKPISSLFPAFRGTQYGALAFANSEVSAVVASGAKIVFLALPHGLATEFALPLLDAGLRVIDLSADFRLKSAEVYREFYKHEHPAPSLLAKSVYGMPELYREQIRSAQLVASPGCYPTSVILPLAPLLRNSLIDPASIVVTSLSGVSGAGRNVSEQFLYAECNESVRPYSVPKHRHLSEMEQELSVAANREIVISFTPHLVPLTRGMMTTIYANASAGVANRELSDALQNAYANEPFVRLLGDDELPDTKHVEGTNFIDIAARFDARTKRAVIFSAQDNLDKGASGQAIQSMNLMCGLSETTGLV